MTASFQSDPSSWLHYSVLSLSHWSIQYSGEAANMNCMLKPLVLLQRKVNQQHSTLEASMLTITPTTFHTRGKYAYHYTNEITTRHNRPTTFHTRGKHAYHYTNEITTRHNRSTTFHTRSKHAYHYTNEITTRQACLPLHQQDNHKTSMLTITATR